MKCVATDCIGIVWEGFNYGAVFEADSGFLDVAGSRWKVAAKTCYPLKIKFGLAPTWTYKSNV
jgi:hypothetical protein